MSFLDTLSLIKQKPVLPKQVLSDSWEERICIKNNGINLFSWERKLANRIENYLKGVLKQSNHLPKIGLPVCKKSLAKKLSEARRCWDVDHTEVADPFWKDVYKLSNDFLDFSSTGQGVMHLRIVDSDSCTKFHTDRYQLRLFTTYLGPGTEWLPEEAINRAALGQTNERIVKDASKIQQMQAGHVGILKGEIQGASKLTKGIVHRSPEIECSGQKRIILRVDI